jgi:hypothetical protein
MENESKGKEQRVQALHSRISELTEALSSSQQDLTSTRSMASEKDEGVKNLQNRVSQVTAQLHDRTKEVAAARDQARDLEDKLRSAQQVAARDAKELQRLAPFEGQCQQLQAGWFFGALVPWYPSACEFERHGDMHVGRRCVQMSASVCCCCDLVWLAQARQCLVCVSMRPDCLHVSNLSILRTTI